MRRILFGFEYFRYFCSTPARRRNRTGGQERVLRACDPSHVQERIAPACCRLALSLGRNAAGRAVLNVESDRIHEAAFVAGMPSTRRRLAVEVGQYAHPSER